MRLDHAEAVLSGVAVGATVSPANGRRCTPVYLDAGGGQVTNCVIRNGFAQDSDPAAAAVYMASADALVTHCVISNCCQLRSNGRGAIYGNGRLSNCLVVGNRAQSGAALIMLTESASLENCTFVENEVAGSGLHLKPAATCGVRNSIFAANLKDAASGFAFTDVPACFSCCLSDVTWLGGESQGRKASAAEVFNDRKRPWHLRPGSPAVNVVPASEVGALASVDLGGHARLVGGKLDLGCYECQSRGMMLMVR